MPEVTVTHAGGKKLDAAIGGFTIRTDQSTDKGGEGTAPNPLQLFFASLAGCAAYFAVTFCQGRDIPTENLSVRLKTGDPDPESKLFENIHIEVDLPEGFPEKYRDGILRSIEQCSVKKHIQAGVAVKTEIVS